MSKLNLPQRAQRFADMFREQPELTQKDAARYGFSQGFRAHQRDARKEYDAYQDELARRFLFISKKGLWGEYLKAKESGEFG